MRHLFVSLALSITAHAALVVSSLLGNVTHSSRAFLNDSIEVAAVDSTTPNPGAHRHLPPRRVAQRSIPSTDDAFAEKKSDEDPESIAQPQELSDPTNGRVYGEEEVDTMAHLTEEPALRYPPGAWRDALEADVPVFLVVDARGLVIRAEVTQPAGNGFDEAALIAARRLRFDPAQKRGRAVPVHVHWICRFRLRD